LSAPANLSTIPRETRVYDLGFFVGAEWTVHAGPEPIWKPRSRVYRETAAELQNLALDALDRCFVVDIIEYIGYPAA